MTIERKKGGQGNLPSSTGGKGTRVKTTIATTYRVQSRRHDGGVVTDKLDNQVFFFFKKKEDH